MWISNTATTAMMLPIAQAVLDQLCKTEAKRDKRELREGRDNQAFELAEVTNNKIPIDTETQSKSISMLNTSNLLYHDLSLGKDLLS